MATPPEASAYSSIEEVARTDVTLCTRLLAHAGILTYSGHVSARVDSSSFLIQPKDDVRATLVRERLIRAPYVGLEELRHSEPPLEVFIHSEIYRLRPDVGAVVHFHHDPTTAFSLIEGSEILTWKNHSARWADGVPIHPDPSQISTAEQGRDVAETLGQRKALILRGHGEVLVAENVKALYADAVHFVENANLQAVVQRLPGKGSPLSSGELDAFIRTFNREKHVEKLWKYAIAMAIHDGFINEDASGFVG